MLPKQTDGGMPLISAKLYGPDDFQHALEQNPQAKGFFETLNRQSRYATCYRIQTAKKPKTQKARIDKFGEMLANNQKLHP